MWGSSVDVQSSRGERFPPSPPVKCWIVGAWSNLTGRQLALGTRAGKSTVESYRKEKCLREIPRNLEMCLDSKRPRRKRGAKVPTVCASSTQHLPPPGPTEGISEHAPLAE